MKQLEVDKDKIVKIPDGYKWCSECNALTPHREEKWRTICIICDDYLYSGGNCPNCGWEEPEDLIGAQEIVVHNAGCHNQYFELEEGLSSLNWARKIANDFKRDWLKPFPERTSYCLPRDKEWYDGHRKLMDLWLDMYNMECSCPRYIVYYNPQIFNFESYSYPSMDCMNAVEWNYSVRCPICGEIYRNGDTNC